MGDAVSGLPRAGDRIAGKYQVEQVLGAGGMGVVVAARHVALKQQVAVKFLLPSATRFPDATARFLREAQAAVAIRSEHVARVLDVGTLETGAPYMVMEYLAGTDLRRLLQARGALPVAEAVDFVLQAGEAIAEAHALGIVHRDLKPANIFLTHRADGSSLVKVLDFGLSKMSAEETGGERGLTATDVVAGSPEYMSPEQVRSLKNVDGRADIWALGVVLYELLTGRRPFGGPTAAAVCASVAADTPAPVRSHRADIPEGLERVIGACLEKDRNRRIATMGELAAALAPFAGACSAASIERVGRLSPMGAGRGSRSEVSTGTGAPLPSIALHPGSAVPPVAASGAPAVAIAVPHDGTVTLPRARTAAPGAPSAAHAPAPPAIAVTAPMAGPHATGSSMTGGAGPDARATGSASSVSGGTIGVSISVPGGTANVGAPDTGSLGPSGHTDGWGQTRRSRAPERKGPIAAVAGAVGAVALTVGIIAWQLSGATAADGTGQSAAGTTAVASGEPAPSAGAPPAVSPAGPLPSSSAVPPGSSAAPSTAPTTSPSPAQTTAPTASASTSAPAVPPGPKTRPASSPAPASPPKKPANVLDTPL